MAPTIRDARILRAGVHGSTRNLNHDDEQFRHRKLAPIGDLKMEAAGEA